MTTLELELMKLKARVERLEAMVRSLISGEREVVPPSPEESLNGLLLHSGCDIIPSGRY